MKKKVKVNWRQAFALLLFLAAVSAGFLQYNLNMFNPAKQQSGNQKEGNFGDPIYVNSSSVDGVGTFAKARIERDESRSQYKDELVSVVNQKSDLEATANAQTALVKLSGVQNTEAKIESILKQKGFKDVLVYIGEDNSMDILVKADKLTQEQAAVISDTASRQAGIGVNMIFTKSCSQ